MKRMLRGAFFLIALFASILGFSASPRAWSDRACHERNRSSILPNDDGFLCGGVLLS